MRKVQFFLKQHFWIGIACMHVLKIFKYKNNPNTVQIFLALFTTDYKCGHKQWGGGSWKKKKKQDEVKENNIIINHAIYDRKLTLSICDYFLGYLGPII